MWFFSICRTLCKSRITKPKQASTTPFLGFFSTTDFNDRHKQ
jgi:hypothetical protein